ncbi:MAG: hypothetical protein PWR10_1839 [Halanaerobiales bacterium]|nr:hypothetical protein [Halanaerobiales bacterium]
MARPITELLDVIRSKNAGPFELTFDLIFKDWAGYREVKEAGIINKELISSLYQIPEEDIISIIYFDPARAIKITIVRPRSAGAVGERDVYGAQQHAPLMTIMV